MKKYETPKFNVGDKVAYSIMPFAHGTITAIQPLGKRNLISIKWNVARLPEKVLDVNLALIGPNPRSANID